MICICEEPSDIYLIEKTGYRGVYHVLGGLLSPLDGIGPDDLHIDSLMERVKSASELIVATDASVEGDATRFFRQAMPCTGRGRTEGAGLRSQDGRGADRSNWTFGRGAAIARNERRYRGRSEYRCALWR